MDSFNESKHQVESEVRPNTPTQLSERDTEETLTLDDWIGYYIFVYITQPKEIL